MHAHTSKNTHNTYNFTLCACHANAHIHTYSYTQMRTHRSNLHKRTETVMRNLAKSRGRDYHKVFLPKPISPMNGTKRKRTARRKRPAPPVTPSAGPTTVAPTVASTPVASTPAAKDRFAFSQDPFGQLLYEEYSLVDDEALVHLVSSDSEAEGPASSAASPAANTPAPCTPSPTLSPTPDTQLDTPSQSFVESSLPDSFPTSPAPSVFGTPSLTPTQSTCPDSYPDAFTPLDRDYAGDYEACMTAVQDLNRFGRVLFRRGGGITGSDGLVYHRRDVLPVLQELKEMLDRMFARIEHA